VAEALSTVMQGALAAGRERYNALVAGARRGTDLDPGAFQAWLREGIAPAVDAAAALRPETAAWVLDALFEQSVGLMVQRVLGPGAREPVVTAGWRRLLPGLPALLSAEPAALSAAVVNALHRLAATAGARPEEWTAAMLRAGPRCADLAAFRDAGLVAAWRAGLAQYRGQALSQARRLDPEVALIVLGLDGIAPGLVPGLLDGVAVDPWRPLEELREGPWGEPRLALVGRSGAFRGFGGLFPAPPRVLARQGVLYALADGECWRLFADCYGAVFQRVALPPAETQPRADRSEATVDESGTAHHRDLAATFEELAGPTSFASDGTTLAVTVATSHAVYLVARR
jgi:hypothetical protein